MQEVVFLKIDTNKYTRELPSTRTIVFESEEVNNLINGGFTIEHISISNDKEIIMAMIVLKKPERRKQ